MNQFSILWLVLAVGPWTAAAGDEPAELDHRLLFDFGREEYRRYRIPSLVVTARGSLLALCEGRVGGGGLTGDIDIVLKRSEDSGLTWSELKVVADEGGHTLGNPCIVLERSSGWLWLAFTRSLGHETEPQIVEGKSRRPTRVYIVHSKDGGRTWSKPADVTSTTKRKNWTWYGTGPGVGIQLAGGRLVIPAYHAEKRSKTYRSHVIYSDDGGKSWRLGGVTGEHCGECQLLQRSGGELYLNARTNHGTKLRTVALSRDGGQTWSAARFERQLYDPHCQGSLLSLPAGGDGKPLWLFANPRGPGRRDLAVRLSRDEGRTWAGVKVLRRGDGQYSCLAALPDGRVGCLYDCWRDGNYRLFFVRFSRAWLQGG